MPAEAAAIAAVHCRSWLATYGEGDPGSAPSLEARTTVWARRLRDRTAGEAVLVAVLGGQVVGFVWVGPTTDPDDAPASVAQVRSVHVDPREQRHGLGRALLHGAAERLSSCGYGDLTLWVVDDNVAARGFYERLGWEADGATREERLAMPGEEGPVVTVVRYRSTVARQCATREV